ncbi:MAG: hypothetical protein P0S95_05125 [Rhabdochlamydiaceae bacterium]|nr:hypothetical protein [Candidatus Amphrikana amoebophyrae]
MYRAILSSIMLTVCAFGFGAQSSYRSAPPPPPTTSKSETQMSGAHTCKHLSPSQQDFAQRLSPMHRSIFCGQFSAEQRGDALAKMLSKSPKYKNITPDDAVEMVINDSRMLKKETPADQTQMKKDAPPPPPPKSYRSRSSRSSRSSSCGS